MGDKQGQQGVDQKNWGGQKTGGGQKAGQIFVVVDILFLKKDSVVKVICIHAEWRSGEGLLKPNTICDSEEARCEETFPHRLY